MQRGFGVRFHVAVPPRAVDPIELERFNGRDDAVDLVCGQRYVVGEAVHETDPASILSDLDYVAGQHGAPAFSTGGPVEYGSAFEVTSGADQCHPVPEGLGLSAPELETGIRPHN